jgi:hypothetical protein
MREVPHAAAFRRWYQTIPSLSCGEGAGCERIVAAYYRGLQLMHQPINLIFPMR